MGYRGRLIWPFIAEIARLDTAGTEALPPPTGHQGDGSGMDKDFREPNLQGADPVGVVGRAESTVINMPCQVEDEEFETLRQQTQGNVPTSRVSLAFHAIDLEKQGLIDANGNANIRVNSRLNRILLSKDNSLVWKPPNPPGLFLTAIRPASFGLSGLKRNLFLSVWEDREIGAVA